MATNEELAVAFLCLAGKTEKNELLQLFEEKGKLWDDKDNLRRLIEAIELPVHQIAKKINYLHSSLTHCPFKKTAYEEMANHVACMTSSLRSPFLKPRGERTGTAAADLSTDHILPLNLNAKSSTQ